MIDSARELLEYAGLALEVAGVGIIVVAAVYASGKAAWVWLEGGDRSAIYWDYRRRFGRGILLGLEFLVAGDLINTVVVEPTLANVGALGIIVLIRTFLSLTLEVEISGRWPWQSARDDGSREEKSGA